MKKTWVLGAVGVAIAAAGAVFVATGASAAPDTTFVLLDGSKKTTAENVGGFFPSQALGLVVVESPFSDFDSDTRVTPSTARSRAIMRATLGWLEAQPPRPMPDSAPT